MSEDLVHADGGADEKSEKSGEVRTLWSVYFMGMDEYEAVSSLKAARDLCQAANAEIVLRGKDDEFEPNIWAMPEIWPWDAQSHAEELFERSGDRTDEKSAKDSA